MATIEWKLDGFRHQFSAGQLPKPGQNINYDRRRCIGGEADVNLTGADYRLQIGRFRTTGEIYCQIEVREDQGWIFKALTFRLRPMR